jgi:predicted AlkP superfamily pyrophosphatase or phosphodiesterase
MRLFALFAAAACTAAAPMPVSAPPETPRLVVLIVIDQFRGEELETHAPLLRYGLRRLRDEGRWYAHAMHTHGRTETAAGHATIATGLTPRWNGVINKMYYDRERGQRVGVCDLGPGPCSPAMLAEPTLGDRLEQAHPESQTVALAQKARSAMLLGGRRADVVAWMGDEDGRLEGRSGGTEVVPAWLSSYWSSVAGPDRVSRIWELPRLPAPYSSWRDDGAGELDMGSGTVFPHRLPPLGDAKKFYEAWRSTPDSDRALVETALQTIRRLQLGADAFPDLLLLSFSGYDAVGHAYGPDSVERVAALIELDRLLGDLLETVREIPGTLVALTSDHGVAPLPERAKQPSGRLDTEDLVKLIEDSAGPVVESAVFPFFYLKRKDRDTIDEVIAALKKHPQIEAAYATSDLPASTEPLARLMHESTYPARSGEVVAVLRPYWSVYSLTRGQRGGADHGSPWPYDRHVPIILWGAGVPQGRIDREVAVIDLGRTLADRLGLPADPRGGAPLP